MPLWVGKETETNIIVSTHLDELGSEELKQAPSLYHLHFPYPCFPEAPAISTHLLLPFMSSASFFCFCFSAIDCQDWLFPDSLTATAAAT